MINLLVRLGTIRMRQSIRQSNEVIGLIFAIL
jgi:hypothetical protein